MFNLENAIQNWKQSLKKSPAFEEGQIKEMETHLRDEVDDLIEKGVSEEEAFNRTVEKFGPVEELEDEVYKTKTTTPDASPPWKQRSWFLPLLPNYFKVALRSMKRKPVKSFINVFGLTVGLTCVILIFLYIRHESIYDRFHEKADRIYRVVLDVNVADGVYQTARTSPPMAQVLLDEFPEVLNTFRIRKIGSALITQDEQRFYEDRFYYADQNILNVLSLSFESGNPETALENPFSLIITQETAQKYFGDDNPIGQTLLLDLEHPFTVTGVINSLPTHSHFSPDFIASFSSLQNLYGARLENWGWTGIYTYLLLDTPEAFSALQPKLQDFTKRHAQASWADNWQLYLQSIKDIHLYSHRSGEIKPNSDIKTSYFLGLIGFFVLLIACINYINLSTVQWLDRKLEVGIRKVHGARRGHLLQQLLVESLLVSLFSTFFAVVLAKLCLPLISILAGNDIVLTFQPIWVFGYLLLSFSVLLALSFTIYPAFFLSRFRLIPLLKGNFQSRNTRFSFRKALVVLQFAISILLIIGTLTVVRQLDFMENANLGFNEKQMVVIPMQDAATSERFSTIKSELLENSNISNVSIASDIPGQGYDQMVHIPEGISKENAPSVPILFVDDDFINTLEIELLKGRNFSSIDETNAFIVNESAVKRFGWNNALGKQISDGEGNSVGPVIGVIKDFHFESLHNEIRPLLMRIQPSWFEKVAVRINSQEISSTLNFLESQWKSFEPAHPFLYSFVDNDFEQFYQSDRRLGKIIRFSSALAILIACLGLFGLAAYATETRTKEIGIRKVLGATLSDIVTLLSKDFIKLVFIGFLIAVPVAWFMINQWLEEFAYRIEIGIGLFLLAGIAAIFIALVAVSGQSIKAAIMNPIESLRSE